MPNQYITIDVAGVEVLKQKVAALDFALKDFSPAWPPIEAAFYAAEAGHFSSEGGGRWKPLAPSTAKGRARTLGPTRAFHPILDVTGSLRKSLTVRGSKGAVRIATKTSLTLGSSLTVGKWNLALLHQKGTARMPAREPLFATRELVGVVKATIQKHIAQQVAKAGKTSIGGQS